jgi:transcriptional regulator with XRE-family HTH domain
MTTPFAREPDSIEQRREDSLAMMRVGDEVRRLREKKGLTLRGLADKVGLSAPFLSDVEHGRRRLSRLDAMAKALGVKVIHFLDVAGKCPHCKGTGFAIGSTDDKD